MNAKYVFMTVDEIIKNLEELDANMRCRIDFDGVFFHANLEDLLVAEKGTTIEEEPPFFSDEILQKARSYDRFIGILNEDLHDDEVVRRMIKVACPQGVLEMDCEGIVDDE